jgi:tryptophanyl-tRNA synthetase
MLSTTTGKACSSARTATKDKTLEGLFRCLDGPLYYLVLMAADILVFRANPSPSGKIRCSTSRWR